MIDKKELMYGNFLKAQDMIGRVMWIGPNSVTINSNGIEFSFRCDEVEPIKIDDIWMDMLGFTRDDIGDSIIYTIYVDSGNKSSLITYYPLKNVFFNRKNCKYVHELQNTCFLLDNIELTINQ